MPNNDEVIAARQEFEQALQKWVRHSREDEEGFLFIQDYTICVSSESMEPGKENMTFMNSIARPGMASYQVIGLLRSSLQYWLDGMRNG